MENKQFESFKDKKIIEICNLILDTMEQKKCSLEQCAFIISNVSEKILKQIFEAETKYYDDIAYTFLASIILTVKKIDENFDKNLKKVLRVLEENRTE